MEVPINRNDIYTLYSNAQSDEEKIEIVAKYIFDLSKLSIDNESDLIDEEIDDLYFETTTKLRKEIIEENSNINKYKLYKAYGLPSKEDYTATEQDFYAEDLFRMQQKIKEQEKELSTIDRGIILSSLEFKEFHEGVGIIYNKKKIGYKVFLKFKKLWKFQQYQSKPNNEITIYENVDDFKENYLIDFTEFSNEMNFLVFLNNVRKKYKKYEAELNDNRSNLYYSNLGIEQSKKLKEKLGATFDIIESYIDKLIWQNYEPTQVFEQSVIIDDNEILTKIQNEIKDKVIEDFESEISEYINERYSSLIRMREYYFNKIIPINQIIEFIEKEIESEKINLLRFQGTTQKEIAEPANITHSTHEYTDEITQNKYSVPQIIKILDKLNFKGMMQEKGFSDFQTVQLLADIFGRSEKTIRNNFDNQNHTKTAENYISDLKKLIAKR